MNSIDEKLDKIQNSRKQPYDYDKQLKRRKMLNKEAFNLLNSKMIQEK